MEPNQPSPPHPPRPALTGPTGAVYSVAFSPDGKTLAAGSADDKVWLWNLTSPAHPTGLGLPLTGPAGAVWSVAFSPDGKTLAAASDDDKVWLWNLSNPASPAPVNQPLTGPANAVYSVAFSPDGKTLAAGGGDGTTETLPGGTAAGAAAGTAQMWNLDVDDAIQRICATTGNALTARRWRQYINQLPYSPPCTHPGHYGLLLH